MNTRYAYLGLGLALVGVMMFACAARAHDWMPPHTKYCCNDKDCLPYSRDALERTTDGWVVKSSGQVFLDGSPDIHVNERPDLAEVWICILPYEAPKATRLLAACCGPAWRTRRGQACSTREAVLENLKTNFGEVPAGIGSGDNGVVVELLLAPSGSWTLVVSYPNGRSCLVGTGSNWEQITPRPGRDS